REVRADGRVLARLAVPSLAFAAVAGVVLAVLAPAPAGAAPAPPAPRLVDIGGHRLGVLRAGAGSPTVVLGAGPRNPLEAWERVWPAVARSTSIVAYSRSGLGRSEPGPRAHTARGAVDDLHALRTALGLRGPCVLVGASYGGLLARLYTSLHPAEVAGLVLVEGVHEPQVQRYGGLDPGYPGAFRQ